MLSAFDAAPKKDATASCPFATTHWYLPARQEYLPTCRRDSEYRLGRQTGSPVGPHVDQRVEIQSSGRGLPCCRGKQRFDLRFWDKQQSTWRGNQKGA